tara:strand:- start:60053 stop:60259 length:207 start_codon:yes stop_codon:yes gene_type:complete
MKNSAQETTHVLRSTDSEGFPQSVEFTTGGELDQGKVRVYFSEMGDYNIQRTERAREIYRDLAAKGWS